MRLDEAPAAAPVTDHANTLVTTATSQPALGTGFAVLGLVSLLDLPRGGRADRVVALGGAAAAGWYLVRRNRRR
ncbi:hypothetical protein AU193_09105 [Mycobacterium sp. GA-1285]|uniref:hypothetical protein n=1 Tax=Mycobacterium sp. GA-1285 TaxID=1772282 RepID=UPI0007471CF5|nr:hypothetical protein [Mycobacterium sp. GA-1285]KUI14159.1 hypothetical protein AU193_09105 [Mycobacterium sp. GA-1285]